MHTTDFSPFVVSAIIQLGNYGQANYSASKGGVMSLTLTLARELGRSLEIHAQTYIHSFTHILHTHTLHTPTLHLLTHTTHLYCLRHGIRCNAILPGFITTQMTDAMPEQQQDKVRSQTTLCQEIHNFQQQSFFLGAVHIRICIG